MVRLLIHSIEACADGVCAFDLRHITDVLIERLSVFERRVRHPHGDEVVDLEIRNASGPWQRTLIRARNLERIEAILLVEFVREEKLVRSDESKSAVDDHGGTGDIVEGTRHGGPVAMLQVVTGSGLGEAGTAAENFAIDRLLEVVVRLLAPTSGHAQLLRRDEVELRIDLVEVIERPPVHEEVIDGTFHIGLRDIGNDPQSNRIHSASGDNVARKRKAVLGAVCRNTTLQTGTNVPGSGVIDGIRRP